MYKHRTKSKKDKKKCNGTSTRSAVSVHFRSLGQRDEYVKIEDYLKQLS